ncbi:MAG TPA: preQ(1) synthase [Fimbriimonadales bacterium]|nr:preQ(1) synthase [Fimbriimonadales bacterium]
MSREILETFENPKPERDYLIEHITSEFTSVCPRTGQPDFATMILRYTPDKLCIELKSLKLYYQSYRNRGVYYEAVVNQILDDIVAVCQPRTAKVIGEFNTRGGIRSIVVAEYTKETK